MPQGGTLAPGRPDTIRVMRTARTQRAVAIVAGVVALAGPAATAWAHIDLQPASPPAGSRTVFTISVPNERSTAATIEVAVRLPDGFVEARAIDAKGWVGSTTTQGARAVVTWTGGARAGRITGANRATFRFSAIVPMREGERLTLPATQTYTNGEVDRWIGGGGAAFPAPTLTIAAPKPGEVVTPTTTTTTTTPARATTTPTTADPSRPADEGGDTALIAGAALAGVAVVGGGFALARRRRASASSRSDDD